MKTALILTLTLLALISCAAPASATWLVYNGSGLEDENGVLLQTGDMIQLIYSPDNFLTPLPDDSVDGMPVGNDVLWETIAIGDTAGSFTGMYDFGTTTGYVFIRFFNSTSMGTVTYYGTLGPHTLDPTAGFDWWDSTLTGAYIWTQYPFIVVPEPATWLLLLPAGILGVVIFRKKNERNKILIKRT